jgi:hypothetical protein
LDPFVSSLPQDRGPMTDAERIDDEINRQVTFLI